MKTHVTLVAGPNENFYHASCLFAGLDALAKRKMISLRLRLEQSFRGVELRIQSHETSQPRIVTIDLHDSSQYFLHDALERSDLYLKRSCYTPDIANLQPDAAAKIQPFGLNYACRSRGSTLRLFRQILAPNLLRGRRGLRIIHGHLSLPLVRQFEQHLVAPLDETIIFQTRVWEPEDTAPGESEIINQGRVEIIRALRNAFGGRFIGGLVPTSLALKRYPAELTTLSTRRRLYTAMSKRNLIGIYTRGLHHSNAFKLAEYIAGSQCIVAEPPRNELPMPLVPGRHYLPFQTPDECIQACKTLLADPGLVRSMRRANHEYYLSQVHPAALAARSCGIDYTPSDFPEMQA